MGVKALRNYTHRVSTADERDELIMDLHELINNGLQIISVTPLIENGTTKEVWVLLQRDKD